MQSFVSMNGFYALVKKKREENCMWFKIAKYKALFSNHCYNCLDNYLTYLYINQSLFERAFINYWQCLLHDVFAGSNLYMGDVYDMQHVPCDL